MDNTPTNKANRVILLKAVTPNPVSVIPEPTVATINAAPIVPSFVCNLLAHSKFGSYFVFQYTSYFIFLPS